MTFLRGSARSHRAVRPAGARRVKAASFVPALAFAAGVGLAGCASVSPAGASAADGSAIANQDSATSASPISDPPASEAAAESSEPVGASCSIGATLAAESAPEQTDPQSDDGAYAPASPAPPGVGAMTRERAIVAGRDARALGGMQGPADSSAPLTVVEESYARYINSRGISPDSRIAPDRCVWVVDVTASYKPDPPPLVDPAKVAASSRYSVVFDVASHMMIDFRARR